MFNSGLSPSESSWWTFWNRILKIPREIIWLQRGHGYAIWTWEPQIMQNNMFSFIWETVFASLISLQRITHAGTRMPMFKHFSFQLFELILPKLCFDLSINYLFHIKWTMPTRIGISLCRWSEMVMFVTWIWISVTLSEFKMYYLSD